MLRKDLQRKLELKLPSPLRYFMGKRMVSCFFDSRGIKIPTKGIDKLAMMLALTPKVH